MVSREVITQKVKSIVCNLFDEMHLDPEVVEYIDLEDDAGMDSLSFISIVIEVEASFNIIIPDEFLRLECFKHISDIVSIVESAHVACCEGD